MSTPEIFIDIYNHVMPLPYLEAVKQHGKEPGMIRRMTTLRMLWDIEARVAMLDQWPQVRQVLTLSVPSPEMLVGPEDSPALARIANDGMADMCRQWPHKFPAFVATLPMNNPAAALVEMDRAINELGARGVQVLTNVNGRALDHPDFFPVFERMATYHRLPVWMHPVRPASQADYADEDKSRYEIWQVLGWPFESSVAMSRMVFSGLFDKLPELKVITHHCGGMLPYFGGRAETLWAQLGSRSADGSEADVLKNLKKAPIDYFKMFYGDTVLNGSTAALKCGLDFFGPDHVVFASDCPFDPEGGPMFIREGMRSVQEAGLSAADLHKVCCGNAFSLLGLLEKDVK
ncbi:MAG: amidohydrolase family protein [Pseudomonadota bacterium]